MQPTVQDLIEEINRDFSISFLQKQDLIEAILSKASRHSPLASFASGVVGGVIGNLITKYFGMGVIGRSVSTVAGFGIGKAIYNNF